MILLCLIASCGVHVFATFSNDHVYSLHQTYCTISVMANFKLFKQNFFDLFVSNSMCYVFWKCRPRLMNFVSSLDDNEVQAVSKASFSTLPDLKSAITTLSSLKGVGPATASAVLAVVAPDIAPFMSDEVTCACFIIPLMNFSMVSHIFNDLFMR